MVTKSVFVVMEHPISDMGHSYGEAPHVVAVTATRDIADAWVVEHTPKDGWASYGILEHDLIED